MRIKNQIHRVAVLLGVALGFGFAGNAGGAEPPTHADLVGRWQGTLAVGDVQLRLVFEVNESEEGELVATLDSPDQGATGIPVDTVELEGDTIRFDLFEMGAIYAGQLNEERTVVTGEWRQSGRVFPLEIERDDGAH